MKKKIAVLHIASFTGNIGDSANHSGFNNLRNKYLNLEFIVTELEIREMFWGNWSFNSEEFVLKANQHDLVVIGGGNFFELWVEKSSTGTTIDLSIETLSRILKPILFYSLGVDVGQGVPKVCKDRFEVFLDYLFTDTNKYFISIRNDGALFNIETLYSNKYEGKIVVIPDGGFFSELPDIKVYEIDESKKNIIINIAGDMLDKRFNQSYRLDEFYVEFANLLTKIVDKYEANIVFIPHIFKDYITIQGIVSELPDRIRRKDIKVSAYLLGAVGHDYIFNIYKRADLVLANRFHSNVCALAMGLNCIGLVNYIQIENLYKEIESEEYALINTREGLAHLEQLLISHLDNSKYYMEKNVLILNEMNRKASESYNKLNKWLTDKFGGSYV